MIEILLFRDFYFCFVCMLWLNICMYTKFMPEAVRGQKNVLDSQEKQDPDQANI